MPTKMGSLQRQQNSFNKLCGRPPQYAPAPCKLTLDLLTLKVVSESRVPILVFLGLSVLDLSPMYATERKTSDVTQTDVRRASLLNAPYPTGTWGFHVIIRNTLHVWNNEQMRSLIHINLLYSKHCLHWIDFIQLSTLNTNQLSLTVTVSLTHQRISLLQFSNRRSFKCFHAIF